MYEFASKKEKEEQRRKRKEEAAAKKWADDEIELTSGCGRACAGRGGRTTTLVE